MQTAIEAIEFFRSKGYPASLFDHPVAGAIRVSAREDHVGAEYYGEAIAILKHTFVLFAEERGWVLRDCNWQRDIDERFDSLGEAASALVEHFTEWAADGGKSVWLGRTKSCT
jgi:hypothetical protein